MSHQSALITELLILSLLSVRAKSPKVRQMAKMKGGKVRKQLKETEQH